MKIVSIKYNPFNWWKYLIPSIHKYSWGFNEIWFACLEIEYI